MIGSVTVNNFKDIPSVTMPLSKLNIFVGENGTGKSSIVHAMCIMKASRGTTQVNTNLPFANLGPVSDLVPRGKIATIGLDGVQDSVEYYPFEARKAGYHCEI